MVADAYNGKYDKLADSAKKEAETQYDTLLANVKKLGKSEVEKAMTDKRGQAVVALAQLIGSALGGGGGGGAADSLLQVPEYKVVIDVATVKCTQDTLGQKSTVPQSVIPFVALVKVRRS